MRCCFARCTKIALGILYGNDNVSRLRDQGACPKAGAEDQRDLRHNAGDGRAGFEHVAICGKRFDPLRDLHAVGIIDPDDRAACFLRKAVNFLNGCTLCFTDSAAVRCNVLAECINRSAVYRTKPGSNFHTAVRRLCKRIDPGEIGVVKKQFQSLQSGTFF